MYIQLYQVKKHLNIDDNFTDDDEYIMQLVEVAEKVVERNIDTKLELLEDGDGLIPLPLMQAMLLLIGNFYANRESVAFANTSNVPYSYQYLIDLYRDYRGKNKRRKKCLANHWELENEVNQDDVDNNEDNSND